MAVNDETAAAATPTGGVEDVHAYCREVEAYLCRRNEGHLIRVVGPSFELVKSWAEMGVPITVAKEGIDRTIDRAERRPGRKRPVRIEFCEGDILDGYDRWRRAVGVMVTPKTPDASAPGAPAAPKRGTLTAHIERVSAQLAVLQGSDRLAGLRDVVQAALGELDTLRATSAGARGAARDAVIAALAALDARLLGAARAATPPERLTAHQREAERDLQAFRGRLTTAQWDAAVAGACARLLRTELALPTLSFD